MTTDSIDVLIVGAGPTGLTLACLLARRGVRVRIVDAQPAPPAGSRGKGLQPRSLELFDDLGIVERIIANGRFGMPMCYHDDAGHARVDDLHARGVARPDAPYLKPLITPQWRIEETLRATLDGYGVRVEHGTALQGFEQHEHRVAATLTTGDGVANLSTRWLIGCDGGKSTVRRLAGIDFIGETLDQVRMLVADLHASGLDRDHWHIWSGAQGFLALCPLPSTDKFQFQASIAPGQAGDTTLDNCQQLLEARTGRTDIRLSDAIWLSLWRANIRMVDRYRVGNVLLAGDAAHVHSPAGGQGMNTGIQDAVNLAWKLAAVLDGADAALIDSYEQERLPIAAWVLGVSSDILNSMVESRTLTLRRNEDTLQLGLGYRESALSVDLRDDAEDAALRAGDRAPDAPGLRGSAGACRMFDLLRGPPITLLGFGARWHGLIGRCVSQLSQRARNGVKGFVIVKTDMRADSPFIVDTDGHAHTAYADDTLFVVRPDNYIGLVTRIEDDATLIAYLKRLAG